MIAPIVSDTDPGNEEVLGVVLANLGTPSAPTTEAVREYLAEFLWDERVVDMARLPWWLILHGFILRFRPKPVARNYQKIWTDQGSPLLAISRDQITGLQAVLSARLSVPVKVVLGMRYGKPTIYSALAELRSMRVSRIVVVPMYPQYSTTTTASVVDVVTDISQTHALDAEVAIVESYYSEAEYISALAASVQEAYRDASDDFLLMSFHGIPQRMVDKGDPYYRHCETTARLLADELGLKALQWRLTFQSRFGREAWLSPATDKVLREIPAQGIKNVSVICPGFSVDCLETLEEIAMQNRDVFLQAGGERFRYIPALNDRHDHMEALASIICRHL